MQSICSVFDYFAGYTCIMEQSAECIGGGVGTGAWSMVGHHALLLPCMCWLNGTGMQFCAYGGEIFFAKTLSLCGVPGWGKRYRNLCGVMTNRYLCVRMGAFICPGEFAQAGKSGCTPATLIGARSGSSLGEEDNVRFDKICSRAE